MRFTSAWSHAQNALSDAVPTKPPGPVNGTVNVPFISVRGNGITGWPVNRLAVAYTASVASTPVLAAQAFIFEEQLGIWVAGSDWFRLVPNRISFADLIVPTDVPPKAGVASNSGTLDIWLFIQQSNSATLPVGTYSFSMGADLTPSAVAEADSPGGSSIVTPTPAATDIATGIPRYLLVGTAGNVSVTCVDGTTGTIAAVAGQRIDGLFRRITAAPAGLVAMY